MACVIGIDVSKTRLDVCRLEDGRRLAVGNDAAGMSALVDRLGIGAQDLILMEASGGYERGARRTLSARRHPARRAARARHPRPPPDRQPGRGRPDRQGQRHQARPPRHPRRPQAGAHRPLHGGCQHQPHRRPRRRLLSPPGCRRQVAQARPHRPDAHDARHPQCHAPHHHPLLTPSQRLLRIESAAPVAIAFCR